MKASAEEVRLVLLESKADEALANAKIASRHATQARIMCMMTGAMLAYWLLTSLWTR